MSAARSCARGTRTASCKNSSVICLSRAALNTLAAKALPRQVPLQKQQGTADRLRRAPVVPHQHCRRRCRRRDHYLAAQFAGGAARGGGGIPCRNTGSEPVTPPPWGHQQNRQANTCAASSGAMVVDVVGCLLDCQPPHTDLLHWRLMASLSDVPTQAMVVMKKLILPQFPHNELLLHNIRRRSIGRRTRSLECCEFDENY
jgi:hypothetical protein